MASAQITLVHDGQPQASIVVPDAAMRGPTTDASSAGAGAQELAEAVQKMTGARLPVRGESAPASDLPVTIYLGDCAANRALREGQPALSPEEYLMQTGPQALHVMGGDVSITKEPALGTLYGVYQLLQQEFGVHWLSPGALGEIMPHRATLELPTLERRGQPAVPKRNIRDVSMHRANLYAELLAELGTDVASWQASAFDTQLWLRRQQVGSRLEVDAGHSFGGFYAKYGQAHPDFFALQPDGTRTQHGAYERLCKSNPALWDFVAQLRIATLRAHPGQQTISICPNDGGGVNRWCMCPQCRALDPPEAPKLLNDRGLIDPATGQPFPEYPALSDRVFTFYNEIARRVHAELPQALLVGYAYAGYRTPPVRLARLEPNLIVGYVGLNHEAIDQWSKLASHLYIRPNDLTSAVEVGLPRNHSAYLAETVKFCVDRHALGFDFDNFYGNWAGDGLDYYLLAQAMVNPALDPHATIADYCRAAYGAGAASMLAYYDRLEKISTAVREDKALTTWGGDTGLLPRYYTTAALGELSAHLRAARAAIPAQDVASLARLALAEGSMEYARRATALLAVMKSPKSPEFAARRQAVVDLLKEQALNPAFSALHSYRFLRMGLARSKRPEE